MICLRSHKKALAWLANERLFLRLGPMSLPQTISSFFRITPRPCWAGPATKFDTFGHLLSTKRPLIHRTVFYLRLLSLGMNKHNGLEISAYRALKVFKVNYILYVDFVIVSENSAVATLSFNNGWNKRSHQYAVLHLPPISLSDTAS